MKTKIFTLFFALMASVGTIFAQSGTCGENLTWNLTDSVLTISGTGEMENYASKRAPWYNYRYSITSAIIENGVTNVGGYAFYYCRALKTAMIGNSVTYIGKNAFYDCMSLTSINIPNSVTSIEEGAFEDCVSLPIVDNLQYADMYLVKAVDKTLSSISIRNGTKWIGRNAFSGCSSLTSVTIPNSVTSIEDYAFLSCSNLTYIEIPNSVTNTGYKPFDGCSRLTSVYLNSDAIVSKNYSSDVYSNIKSIFGSQVENYIIGNEVTSIGGTAFWDCRTLKSVELPNSITSIGENAFGDCYNLTSIEIPNSVTSIGHEAFSGCSKLASVTIPESVTSIGTRAFESCSSLTSVTIPDSVTSIEDYTFWLCSGLKSVSIGNNTTSIGEYAFRSCSKLTSITIPNSVTSIGIAAFENCSGLKSIQCEAITPPTCANRTFDLVTKSIPVYVPAGSVAAYQAADGWKDFGNIQAIENTTNPCSIDSGTCGENLTWTLSCDSVLTISGTGAMENYASSSSSPWYSYRYSIQSIVIENGVTSIGNYAFYLYNCTALTNVTIPNSVISIGNHAFSSYSLTSIEIPNSVISIGDYAFSSSNLTSIEIPNSVTSIGNYAFGWCRNLSSVIVGSSVTSIGNDAFTSCSSLTSVTLNSNTIASAEYSYNSNIRNIFGSKITEYIIGDSVTRIGSHAFQSCTNLISVSISNSVTSIGGGAFDFCKSLTSITIPNSVTSIEGYAFMACYSLNTITLSNNIDSINIGTFEGDSSLTSITIPNSVTYIGEHAFWGCTGLTSIDIPSSVQYIEASGTFTGCTNLVSINVASNNPYYTSIDGILFSKNLNSIVRYPEGKSYTEYTIPDGIHYIWNYAFSNCNKLTSVSLPSSITHIYSNAFDGCSGLTNIILPNSVTSFGYYVFKGCNSLTSITCEAETPPTCRGNYTFDYVDKSIPLYVPAESVAAYQAANGWSEFTNILPIEGDEPCVVASGTCGENLTWTLTCDSVLTISGTGEMTDWQDTYYTPWYDIRFSVKQIVIEEGVTSIGKWAFGNCVNVSSVTIPNGVTRIADWAFGGCQMETLEIPNSVLSIGEYAFYTCESLKNLTLSGNLLSIGQYAFCYCHNLTSIELPNKLTTLDEGAFRYCSGLSSVTIPNSVTSIGIRVFGSCSGLNSIIVASNNSNYSSEDGVLFNKDKTTLLQFPGAKVGAYAIPQGVINIAQEAFMGSSLLLTSIVIPSSVASIGERAFYDCVYFASITCEAVTPPTCGDEVFFEVDKSVCTLYVPAQSITAYQTATGWRDFGNILPIQTINYATIADLYNMAQDSTFTLGAFDVVYVPDFQNGANMYIKDETGSMVIYKVGYGLQAGDHVEAGLQGRINIYHGLYEVAPVSAKEDLTVTAGDAPAPMVATEVPSATNVNQFVVYKNVSFATDTAFVESKRHAVHGTWNNQQITFYNQYYIGAMLSANKTYNITAVNTIYGTTPQAYPLAVEEVTTDTIEPCHTISGTCGTNLTWELSCDSVLTISGTGAMVDNPSWSPYVSLIKVVIMPEGLTIIGRNAFAECVNLESAHIPESVTAIGPAAFYNCSALTSINMPDSVRMLGHKAFVGCESLTEPVYNAHIFGFMPRNYCGAYSIPEGIVSVAAYAFCGIASATCSGLTEITIPSSVKRLGVEAFGLLFLRKITCLAVTPPTCDSTTFEWYLEETGITVKVNRSIPVYVPAESVDAYKAADVWKEFFNILPIGGTIEPQDSIYDVVYLDQAGLQLDYEPVTLHLPEAPQIEGFTFLKWQVVAGDLENGIHIQAVYTANEPTNAPEVYTNPANKAQKLIRNGKVYILTDDKVYSISGQKVK